MEKLVDEKRSIAIKIKLTPSEAKTFDSFRQHMRRAVAARLLILRQHPPKQISPEVKKLAADLNRIGNNLNQIARALNINMFDQTELQKAQIEVMKLRESITS